MATPRVELQNTQYVEGRYGPVCLQSTSVMVDKKGAPPWGRSYDIGREHTKALLRQRRASAKRKVHRSRDQEKSSTASSFVDRLQPHVLKSWANHPSPIVHASAGECGGAPRALKIFRVTTPAAEFESRHLKCSWLPNATHLYVLVVRQTEW